MILISGITLNANQWFPRLKNVFLHIGAIEDYPGVELMLNEMGMKLLIPEAEHLLCSTD